MATSILGSVYVLLPNLSIAPLLPHRGREQNFKILSLRCQGKKMQHTHPKTLQDLEFPTVLQQLSDRCTTDLGKAVALEIEPLGDEGELIELLGRTSEYLASFDNGNRIPNHYFDQIKIGRASCRERVWCWVVGGRLK